MGDRHSRSEEQAGTGTLPLSCHSLLVFFPRLLDRNFWGSWPGSCLSPLPCPHLEALMAHSSPPPGECWPRAFLGHFSVSIVLCVFNGLVCRRVLCYLLSGGFAGVRMSVCVLRGICCSQSDLCGVQVAVHLALAAGQYLDFVPRVPVPPCLDAGCYCPERNPPLKGTKKDSYA